MLGGKVEGADARRQGGADAAAEERYRENAAAARKGCRRRAGQPAGDLLFTLRVTLPDGDWAELEEVAKRMQAKQPYDPRVELASKFVSQHERGRFGRARALGEEGSVSGFRLTMACGRQCHSSQRHEEPKV